MTYRVYAFGPRHEPRPYQSFPNIETALGYCTTLMPAKPHDVEIGLRFEAEVAKDGGVYQMSLHRPASGDAWWDRFFENPHGLRTILIQREDAARASDDDLRDEGNRPTPAAA